MLFSKYKKNYIDTNENITCPVNKEWALLHILQQIEKVFPFQVYQSMHLCQSNFLKGEYIFRKKFRNQY